LWAGWMVASACTLRPGHGRERGSRPPMSQSGAVILRRGLEWHRGIGGCR
jgi:hypothetical protein